MKLLIAWIKRRGSHTQVTDLAPSDSTTKQNPHIGNHPLTAPVHEVGSGEFSWGRVCYQMQMGRVCYQMGLP